MKMKLIKLVVFYFFNGNNYYWVFMQFNWFFSFIFYSIIKLFLKITQKWFLMKLIFHSIDFLVSVKCTGVNKINHGQMSTTDHWSNMSQRVFQMDNWTW